MGKAFGSFLETVLNISTVLTAPIPVFKNGPKIETFGYTEAKIIVNDFELEGTSDNADSRYEYTIQYKVLNKIDKIFVIQKCIYFRKQILENGLFILTPLAQGCHTHLKSKI